MIKIEVTGNSIGEVADKLLAIGANLRGSAIIEGARAAVNAMQAMKAEPVKVEDEVVFTPDVAVGPAPEQAEAPSAPAPETLNFDTDVAPHVLALVSRKDKAAAQEVLSQFGVEKASLLDPIHWPELVSALKDAM